MPIILYTYKADPTSSTGFVCHAYGFDAEGAPLNALTADTLQIKLKTEQGTDLTTMILNLETAPA